MTLHVVATDVETGETFEATIPDGSYVLLCTEPCHLAHEQWYSNGTRCLTLKGYREGAGAKTRTAWSWTPPPEPGPDVLRLRPVERYPGDNGVRIDRHSEPDDAAADDRQHTAVIDAARATTTEGDRP